MTTITVSSGVTSSGLVISSTMTLNVAKGGINLSGLIGFGAIELVGPDALDKFSTVAGGRQIVSGEVISQAVEGATSGGVFLAGTETLISGGVASGVRILDEGFLEIGSGGLANGAIVSLGGAVNVQGGGHAFATRIFAGGSSLVEGGGVANATTVSSGGIETIGSGGIASNGFVAYGGEEVLSAGGTASAITVASGGVLELATALTAGAATLTAATISTVETSAVTVSGVTISSGGKLVREIDDVDAGAVLVIGAGFTIDYLLEVEAGGVLSGPGAATGTVSIDGTVSGLVDEGRMDVFSKGIATGVTVQGRRADLQLFEGATASATHVGVDSLLEVLFLASSFNTVVSGYDAVETVEGGTAVGTIVRSGGMQILSNGGIGSNTIVDSGGFELVLGASKASNVMVHSGGGLGVITTVGFGAVATVAPFVATSATVISGVTLLSGAYRQVAGGTIMEDGEMIVPTGRILYGDATVQAGGLLVGPGVAQGAVIDQGMVSGLGVTGQMVVSSGGVASGVGIDFGGDVAVSSGGQFLGGIVASGGELDILSGASVFHPLLQAGARIDFESDLFTSAVETSRGVITLYNNGAVVDTFDLSTADGAGLTFSGLAFDAGVGSTPLLVSTDAHEDLMGYGLSDIVLQNSAGALEMGRLGAASAFAYTAIGSADPTWTYKGTGDFLGPGHGWDILEENSAGQVIVGQFNGSQESFSAIASLGAAWTLHGTGDFLGDGYWGVLIQNSAGVLDDLQTINGQTVATQIGGVTSQWTFETTGDFYGDGRDQFLLRNTSGVLMIGEVVNGQIAYQPVGTLDGVSTVEETGDFLGHGKDDFLVKAANGAISVGEVSSGGAGASYTAIGALGAEWDFVGAGSYAGGSADSFLLENHSTGAIYNTTVSGTHMVMTQVGSLDAGWLFRT